jgi:outer membrane protein assembly factor BamD (BamD/ComL family)
MGWFRRLFSASGRAESLYKQGLKKAQRKDYAGAVTDYTAVIESEEVTGDVKAMALFNRGLLYAEREEVEKASQDFAEVVALPHVPASVLQAAKEKQERLRKWGRH